MMSPFRSYSSKRRPSDVDKSESFRLIEVRFSPLCNEDWDLESLEYESYEEFAVIAGPRDYGSRQEYLRSYKFSRPDRSAPAEKMKDSLLRLKAAVWAIVACNYQLPLGARMFKEKIAIRTSQFLSDGAQFLRPSCMQMPKCLIATS
jgi:hypothetical protein